jgi:hypothetical protein
VVAALYSGAADPDFLAASIEPACITREGAGAFFQRQGYPWPAGWGASPSAESVTLTKPPPAEKAAAIDAEDKNGQPATDTATRLVALKSKEDSENAYKLRITEGQYPTAADDEAWRKEQGLSRQRIRELRKNIRPAKEQRGGHPKGRRKG